MEPIRDDTELVATLESLRSAPRAEFAAELDDRVDAGFPPTPRRGLAAVRRLRLRIGAFPRRRLPAIATAAAAGAIAVATAAVAISEEPGAPSRGASNGAGGTQLSGPPPSTSGRAAGGAAQLSAPTGARPSAGQGSESQLSEAPPPAPPESSAAASGPYASQARSRRVERSTNIVLATPPSELRDDAARVFQAVREYHGIVLHSSVSEESDGGQAGFDLLVPTGSLEEAVATLTGIADVVSRQDSTQDVTARSIGLGERLQDARATVASLLRQLAAAESEAERSAVEEQLHAARLRLAAIRSRLSALERRVHLSSVLLRIEADPGAAGAGGSWGFDDALRDAGHVLTIAAGVTLIALAVLAPLALIVALVWLGRRGLVQRSRERALDSAG